MSTDTHALKTTTNDRAEKDHPRASTPPPVDIYENADELLVVADLPGVTKDGLNISFEKGQLLIEGRRDLGVQGAPLATEYRAADFRRAFLVPNGIDAEKISASLDSGILRVHLPKSASIKPRQIQVKAG